MKRLLTKLDVGLPANGFGFGGTETETPATDIELGAFETAQADGNVAEKFIKSKIYATPFRSGRLSPDH